MEEYFTIMRAGGTAVADMFSDDAQLVGLGVVVRGRPAIREFYSESIRIGRPHPELVGDLLIEGNRVAAEVYIRIEGNSSLHVVDLFQVDGERITSLTYFVADYPGFPGVTEARSNRQI